MTRRLLARRLKIIGVGCVATGLVFLAAQFALRWGADYYVRERAGIPVRIGRLFVNPATSHVSLSLVGEMPGQELKLDLGDVRFDWWTVFLKRLRLGRIHVQGLRFAVVRDASGRTSVGGIPLALQSTKSEKPPQPVSPPPARPWGLGMGGIDIRDVRLDYRDPEIKVSVLIHSFHMDPAESWHAGAQTPFEGDLEINGGRLRFSGTCRPFRADPSLDARLQFSAFPLAWVMPALKLPGVDGDFDATWVVDGLEVHVSSVAPVIRLQRFELSKGRVTLEDRTLRPAFRWSVASMGLMLAGIDTSDPLAQVSFTFNAKLGRYEQIALKGLGSLFGAVPDGHLELQIDGFNLMPFTPFTEKQTGYRVVTGWVDLKSNVDVRRGVHKAGNHLIARRFHLDKLRADELDPSDKQIGLPLNLCLSLLREADDTIRLNVPLEGDLRGAKGPVGKLMRPLIAQALASALRAAATAFFSSGTRFGFDPILFAPGQAQLTPEAAAYLATVGEKLSQRPEVGLKLSGWAAPVDWYALKKKRLPAPVVPLDPAKVSADDNTKLLALAAQRAESVRAYLAATYSIDPNRLSGMPPQLDPSEGSPRAELSL